MTILAIDPGFEKIGYAIFEKKVNGKTTFDYQTSGLIKTPKSELHEKRLLQLYNELSAITDKTKPSIIVLEQLFFFKNQKTVIGVGQAQGVILLLAAQRNIPIHFLTPLQIKHTITGYGNADKIAVRKMLTLLMKNEIPKCEDDQTDAIACGLAYCYLNQRVISL